VRDTEILRRRARVLLGFFVVGLVLSGLTAFPIVMEASERYPFLFYGTDWLAFGHLVIAIAFLGPLRDPVRNIWVIEWGMIACVLVIPTAMLCGPIRGIPFWWRLIDCSFGIFGILPLALARRCTGRMAPTANK